MFGVPQPQGSSGSGSSYNLGQISGVAAGDGYDSDDQNGYDSGDDKGKGKEADSLDQWLNKHSLSRDHIESLQNKLCELPQGDHNNLSNDLQDIENQLTKINPNIPESEKRNLAIMAYNLNSGLVKQNGSDGTKFAMAIPAVMPPPVLNNPATDGTTYDAPFFGDMQSPSSMDRSLEAISNYSAGEPQNLIIMADRLGLLDVVIPIASWYLKKNDNVAENKRSPALPTPVSVPLVNTTNDEDNSGLCKASYPYDPNANIDKEDWMDKAKITGKYRQMLQGANIYGLNPVNIKYNKNNLVVHTELPGGEAGARECFKNLTGVDVPLVVIGEYFDVDKPDGTKIMFRPKEYSKSNAALLNGYNSPSVFLQYILLLLPIFL